jgi:uncharacterized protein (DUF1778 family)
MSNSQPKSVRLVARASEDVQRTIQQAAEFSGATMSQFIIDATMSKATAVIDQARNIYLSLEEANTVFAILENPPSPNNAFLAAAREYKTGDINRESIKSRNRTASNST